MAQRVAMEKISFWLLMCSAASLGTTAQNLTDQSAHNGTDEFLSTTLTLCILMESNTTGKVYDYNRGIAAIDLAIQYAEERILPDSYHLQTVFRDLGDVCSSKTHVVALAMDLLQQGVICNAFVGPGCGSTAESLSDLAEYNDILIIGLPAAALGLSAQRIQYTNVFRVSISHRMTTLALMKFFAAQSYTSPTFFGDQAISFFQQLDLMTRSTLSTENFALYAQTTFVEFDSTQLSEASIMEMYQQASLRSRVFIIYGNAKTVRRFMVVAHRMGMTKGEYVFVAVELFKSKIWGEFTCKGNEGNESDVKEAFKSLLLLSLQPDYTIDTTVFWTEVKKLSKSKYNYSFGVDEELDPIIMHFFDAITVFSSAAVLLIQNNTKLTGRNFVNQVADNSVYSPVSGEIHFDSASNRVFNYILRSFNNNTGKHEALYGFPWRGGPVNTFGILDWFGNDTLPPNTPRCGFIENDPICKEQPKQLTGGETAAAVIFPLLLSTALVVGGTFVIRRLFFYDADPFWWRIFLHEIESEMRNKGLSSKSINSMTSTRKAIMQKQTLEAEPNDDRIAIVEKVKKTVTIDGETSADDDDNDMDMDDKSIVEKQANKAVVTIGTVLYSSTALSKPKRVPGSLQREAQVIRRLQNPNIQKLIGVVVNEENHCVFVVGELCARGSLRDLIGNVQTELDWPFKNSLMKDLANGMAYLHSTSVISHGFLSDTNLLIDSRFVLKVSGYGLECLVNEYDLQIPSSMQTDRNWRMLLWRAPELLRRTMPPKGTQKGDVYSFAILLQQIILRTDPFEISADEKHRKMDDTPHSTEIVMEVKRGSTPPTRPTVPMSTCSIELHELLSICWEEEPYIRPSFSRIKTQIMKLAGTSGDNIVDHLVRRMEQYSSGLENQVEQRTKQFLEERLRSQELLQTLLPKSIAAAILQGQTIYPQTFSNTTVYMGNVHGFNDAVEAIRSPYEVVNLLNRLYALYDEVLVQYDVFRVETMNDAMMVVSGLPVEIGTNYVEEITSMALDVRRKVGSMKASVNGPSFKMRVGINSGPCIAGVIGLRLPKYCIFGDTVSIAHAMESHGEAGKIHCSESTKILLDSSSDFVLIERGEISIQGKGVMRTYWLIGRN